MKSLFYAHAKKLLRRRVDVAKQESVLSISYQLLRGCAGLRLRQSQRARLAMAMRW